MSGPYTARAILSSPAALDSLLDRRGRVDGVLAASPVDRFAYVKLKRQQTVELTTRWPPYTLEARDATFATRDAERARVVERVTRRAARSTLHWRCCADDRSLRTVDFSRRVAYDQRDNSVRNAEFEFVRSYRLRFLRWRRDKTSADWYAKAIAIVADTTPRDA